MGMFDYVNVHVPCPKCGSPVEGFQSKGGPCAMAMVEPEDVSDFYDKCGTCGLWITFCRDVRLTERRNRPVGLEELTDMGFVLKY